jgi:two-component system cell cycle response regulator
VDNNLIIKDDDYSEILAENEELKGMLALLKASNAITATLDPVRAYTLLADAIAIQAGVSRFIGLFMVDGGLEVKVVHGLSDSAAGDLIDAIITKTENQMPQNEPFRRFSISDYQTAAVCWDSDILEGSRVYVQSESGLIGIIVLLNDPGAQLPDISLKTENIIFLLEQSKIAFANAATYVEARDLLFIDELSGLFNYRYLDVALDRELKRAQRYSSNLAILFLDMDTFKDVNDKHGHLVGSQVLGEMGRLLGTSVRDVDVVIRYGGDEYTIILVETDAGVAGMVAERIRMNVEAHAFQAELGLNIRLTCSIGYSCCPEDSVTKKELLEMADKAMYVSKSSGRNCVSRYIK